MKNRREFLKLGATASALGLVAGTASARQVPGLNWKVNGIDKHLVNAPVFEGPL
ncbi:twin-arginine translocation signal domain-containing protein [Jhaorihella thermophila]|uniref:twin-arginine translocation signal domain-containing protein n=1 Tax=Jhaorihella thermophila TaxID=488547 RepID=UPI0036198598